MIPANARSAADCWVLRPVLALADLLEAAKAPWLAA
jgi:hypothetical protein